MLGLLALLIWKVVHQDKGVKLGGGGRRRPRSSPSRGSTRRESSKLASLRGKVVVLNFWASWCAPCKSEAPRLEAAWQRYRDHGVVVVGVDGQDFSAMRSASCASTGSRIRTCTTARATSGTKYGVTGFPETYFVDRRGRLVGDRVVGEVSAEKLTSGIQRALES